MGKDLLVILMIAFGLFAVIMFVLFYAYLKKYHNEKNLSEDFEKEIDNKPDEEDEEDIIGNSGIDDSKEEVYTPPVFEEHEKVLESVSHDESAYNDASEQNIDTSEYALNDDSGEEFIPVRKE